MCEKYLCANSHLYMNPKNTVVNPSFCIYNIETDPTPFIFSVNNLSEFCRVGSKGPCPCFAFVIRAYGAVYEGQGPETSHQHAEASPDQHG